MDRRNALLLTQAKGIGAMAAPSKQSSSRWGSFLQQAVAGVESRLDTILAEGDEASTPGRKPTAIAAIRTTTKPEGGLSLFLLMRLSF